MVEAVGFDTTATNTGKKKGAAAKLQKRLSRTLLWLPCRHHIFELIVKEIFIVKLKFKSKKPNIEMFETLKNSWNSIDKTKLPSAIDDEIVSQHLSNDFCEEMLNFCLEHLQNSYRDDYRELLELVVIFLGGQIPGGNRLLKPGAMHQAR